MSLIQKISLFLKKKQGTTQGKEEKPDFHNYIGKFVKQNGTKIGESIALDETRFIVKIPDGFISVPIATVTKNTENIEIGDFNMEESRKLGNEWFERKDTLQFDKNGMMVTGNSQ
ncbi:MAG: hypothetical protein FIB08_11710 [Candidatus Methanoperedens sp.]|nr:hypothetical protein [Candidatus Methanoperedens sp.]